MTDGGTARRRESLAIAALAAVVYLLLSSAAPRWGDSADLVRRAVAAPLAPNGRSYPLQSALIRLVDVVTGDPARASTIVTALLAAAGVGLLHRICRRHLGCGPVASLGAAGAWAVSHTWWSSAVDGEVYVLLGVFALAACGTILAARDGVDAAWLAGVVVGLTPLHHRASLFVVPVVLAAPVVLAPASLRRAAALRVALGAALGAVPFAVLVVLDAARAPGGLDASLVSRVLVGSPRNATLFLASERPLLASLAYAGRWTLFTFPGPALPLAAWGLVALLRTRRREAVLLLLFAACALALPLRFDAVGDRYVFLVGAYPVVAIALAAGIDAIDRRRHAVAVACAALCVAVPPCTYAALAWSAAGRGLLPGLAAGAAEDFLLPARRGDPGSSEWAVAVGRAIGGAHRIHAEWGAAAALDYARDIRGSVPPAIVVVRRRPTPEEVRAAGEAGVLFALTPIWADERARLPSVGMRAEPVAPSLYRLLPAE